MQDRYLTFTQSAIGQRICKIMCVPVPPILIRAETTNDIVNNILIGSAINQKSDAPIVEPELEQADKVLNISDVIQSSLEDALLFFSSPNYINVYSKTEHTKPNNNIIDKDTKLDGLVFDATNIEKSDDLIAMFTFFNSHIKQLNACAKIVVIGLNPSTCILPQYATVQRGLLGFVKSLAKEVGRKGITANIIYSNKNTQLALTAPLRFLMSYKSAYISGQSFNVDVFIKMNDLLTNEWNKPLANKVALVTGASRGIGAEIAKTLARDGAKVIGLDIEPAKNNLHALMSAIGGESITIDITNENAPNHIVEQIKALTGTVDIVVHNAGITQDKMLSTMNTTQWSKVISINLTSIERINAKLLADSLINTNGRIIGVSSISGIAGNVGQTNYATSKASVIGMVESVAPTLVDKNITINAVAPGFIETEMTASIPLTTRFFGRRLCSLSQGGLPIDVAETISFLVSPNAQGISGNVIRVCGQSLIGS